MSSVEVVTETAFSESVAEDVLPNGELGSMLTSPLGDDFSDDVTCDNIGHGSDEEADITGSLVMRVHWIRSVVARSRLQLGGL